MIAEFHIFTHSILDHESLVTVQAASSTVAVEQSREWTQVDLPQWGDEALIKAQFIKKNLDLFRDVQLLLLLL